MSLKKLIHLSSILILVSCASGHQQTSERLRKFVVEGKYDDGVSFLKESPLAMDEASKLLFLTELGLLEHYRGNYPESTKALTEAKELIDALYTTRVSGKLKSFLNNDNSDLYYGEKYEASLVYFYLSLNNYMQAMLETDGAKRKAFMEKARAEVVAWDSFLSEIKKDRMGEDLFKEDLLAKTFGALVHESLHNPQDDQIALQLYKDAQVVFFRNYNLFPTFNNSFETFRKNFALLPTLPAEEVAGKYVRETEQTRTFKDFLSSKIQNLSKKMANKSKASEGSISFLIQDGLIAEKVPQKFEFPMAWGGHQAMAFSMGMGGKISFELPAVQGVQHLETSRLQALNADGSIAKDVALSVIAPLSDLAEQAITEHSAAIAAKTATRVATKHISALIASAATYEAGKRNNNSMTMMLALAGHAAAVATINNSEKADVRFWSTLPSSIRMGHLNLPTGKYQFRVVYENQRTVDLGSHQVGDNDFKFVMGHKDIQFKKVETELKAVQMAEVKPDSSGRAISSETKP